MSTQGCPSPDFADRDSIVRTIWGNGDMALLVFAGSAAEFALNRAVDWLFFTGKLPGDPIGRLFSTAAYAQQIVFADVSTASGTFDRMRAVHEAVERQRGQRIPDWAHRDVLYMLVDYSERAHELLARPLSAAERRELYDVFYRVGSGLQIADLPKTYADWREDRKLHLRRDLFRGEATEALYSQYRNQLGVWRYQLLLRVQTILAPAHVRSLLGLKRAGWLRLLIRFYPVLVRAGLRAIIQRLLIPAKYLAAVRVLDHREKSTARPRSSARRCPFHRTRSEVDVIPSMSRGILETSGAQSHVVASDPPRSLDLRSEALHKRPVMLRRGDGAASPA